MVFPAACGKRYNKIKEDVARQEVGYGNTYFI